MLKALYANMKIQNVNSLNEEDWIQVDKIMPSEHSINSMDLFLINRIDDRIIGYLKRDGSGHIHALFIDGDFRAQGVGQGLLYECINISVSEAISELSAGVKNNNDPALRLFRKNGFREHPTGNNHIMFTKRHG